MNTLATDSILDGRIYERRLSYEILRGSDKIGENLIEIMGYGQNILLECGRALTATADTSAIERRVLRTRYDAVIITHAHADHCGLLDEPLAASAIYMGEHTRTILCEKGRLCRKNEDKTVVMTSGESFFLGEIRITPHLCDHSVADSYMIEVSDNIMTILYTGDFRSHGRKSFDALLRRLPTQVDVLICERTTDVPLHRTEQALEEDAARLMQTYKDVFVLQSSVNVDRIVSFYKASRQTGRPLLVPPIVAQLTRHMSHIPNPKTFADCFLYFPRNPSKQMHTLAVQSYGARLISRDRVAAMPSFTMLVTAGMLDYIKRLAARRDLSHAVLVYSIWRGYKADMRDFLDGVRALGIEVVDLHVSGHADRDAIDALIAHTHPRSIRYVHTDGVVQ